MKSYGRTDILNYMYRLSSYRAANTVLNYMYRYTGHILNYMYRLSSYRAANTVLPVKKLISQCCTGK